MKLSKDIEAEIRQIYQTYWDAYLSGDFDTFASFLDDDIVIYGTAVGEIFTSKEEALKFYIATGEEMTGKAEFRNRNITIQPVGDTIVIYEQSQLHILIEDTWTFYGFARISGIFERKSKGWKLVHQHGSFPDSRTEEGQQIASEKIKEENLQLREAVQRRTVELENTNRELAIEASLERVRTVAMSMRKPDDMLDVCLMISEQLEILGVRDIRNVQTAIIHESGIGTYMNYQHFTQYREGLIEKVEIAKHPAVQDMIRHMQSSPDAFFSHSFTGSELEKWKKYRRDENQLPDPILEDSSQVHFYFYSIGQGGLGLSTYTPLTENNIAVFHRFRNVFALAYQRFRDIEQAEAQVREAQIELALERVRARTMAMQRSEELSETAHLLFQQFTELGESPLQITIGIVHEEEGFIEFRVTHWAGGGLQVNRGFNASIEEPTLIHKIYTAWKEQQKSLVVDLSGKELEAWIHYRNAISGVQVSSTDTKGRRVITCAFYSKGHISFSSPEPRPKESIQLLERFAGVFDQTYTRFLDLQKAEAQAREAKIETALERVRSRTMGMQQSHELGDVAIVLFKELNQLVENLWTCGFVLCEKDRGEDEWWLSTGDGFIPAFYLPNTVDPTHANIYAAWKKGETYHTEQLEGEALQEHYDWLMNIPVSKNIFDEMKAAGHSLPAWQKLHCAYFSFGYLVMITQVPCPEEQLFQRFALVFDQTYTRFLDLQKAEAQAREAQIEASLERVRTRSMGMQKSKELKEVIQVVFEQFIHLKINIEHTGFVMDYMARDDYDIWVADPLGVPSQVTIPYFDCIYYNQFNDAKERGIDFFATNLTFEEKNTFYQKLFEYIPGLSEEAKKFYFSCPGLAASTVLLDNIGLYIENFSGIPFTVDENATLMRFGKVFQQTYTRFLDLQKVEAQAREAMIETALEKVRSRTMAMKHSDELQDAAIVLFQQIKSLDVETGSCGFNIWDKDKNSATVWMSSPEGGLQEPFKLMHTESEIYKDVMEAVRNRKNILVKEVSGEALKKHFDYLLTLPGIGTVIKELRNTNYSFPERMIYHFAFFHQGYLSFHLHASRPETHDIFKRFANVFEQTYTRFLDLQKSESQTQKVKVEVALERVRARALAMQEPEELIEVAQVMRHEMGLLGIEELETSSIYIHDEGSDIADCWYAIKDIRVPEKKLVSDHIRMELHKTWVGREMLEFYNSSQQQASIVMQGAQRIEWIKYCSGISEVLEDFYGEVIPDRTYHLYKFSNGAIGAAAEGDISEESWELLRRATSVFSLAYSRFKDLTQARIDLLKLKTEKQRAEDALLHLKAAQAQLIQSEKMASLGELTAGIAHEIQNPLNFVNNFSDVNKELLVELQDEIDKENLDEVKAIAKDIIANEDKINHHGKRADAIVKGMLMHSRTSGGVKEPTDINALADEYLRLAYHGLRAKDKTFNATMKTEFDESIGKINVVPQDIGRVILNLITNAFYAVSSMTPYPLKGGLDYIPTVTVSTKLQHPLSGGRGSEVSVDRISDGAMVTISVSDNGPGIPHHMLDKIFQPFFTTKPTGQGTGLGLSLSYDIVKAHGGELRVVTKEGEGSVFTIQLPIS